MPFYSYRCPTCDERFEVRRTFAEYDQPMSCPEGHENAERVITSWGTGGGIRSGTPDKSAKAATTGGTMATIESDAKKIAKHKRHAG